MKYLYYALLALLVILSLAAGSAKVASMPQEVEFFASAGLPEFWLLPLGIVQVVGALASLHPKSRGVGLILVALGFLSSSLVIFATGNVVFGAVSLVPVALSLGVRSGLSQS